MRSTQAELGIQARRCGLIALLLAGSLLALVAAPATAVLMIPRVKDWQVGGGVHWLIGAYFSFEAWE